MIGDEQHKPLGVGTAAVSYPEIQIGSFLLFLVSPEIVVLVKLDFEL